MRDWRGGLQKQSLKYVVIGIAMANCLGIYLAHDRLSRPYAGPAAGTPEAVADFADAAPAAEPALAPVPSAPEMATAVDLGIDAGPPRAEIAMSTLPELAPLPVLKVEAAPVIPSVPAARIMRAGKSEQRSVRRRPASERVDAGFEAAFTPDYAALAPYDGTAESAGLAETVKEADAMGAGEVRSEALSIGSTAMPVPALSATAADAPATDAAPAAPAELPAVELSAPAEVLPG